MLSSSRPWVISPFSSSMFLVLVFLPFLHCTLSAFVKSELLLRICALFVAAVSDFGPSLHIISSHP